MKTTIILLLSAVVLSTLFSTLISISSVAVSADNKVRKKKIISQIGIADRCSLVNAGRINQESSSPNRPVRKEGQEFLDGIVLELTTEQNDPTLAKRILNAKSII